MTETCCLFTCLRYTRLGCGCNDATCTRKHCMYCDDRNDPLTALAERCTKIHAVIVGHYKMMLLSHRQASSPGSSPKLSLQCATACCQTHASSSRLVLRWPSMQVCASIMQSSSKSSAQCSGHQQQQLQVAFLTLLLMMLWCSLCGQAPGVTPQVISLKQQAQIMLS